MFWDNVGQTHHIALYAMSFPSCIAIEVGSLVHWVRLLSHHKRTAPDFIWDWAETTGMRCFGQEPSITAVPMSKQTKPMGENTPGSERNAPNEPEVQKS